MSIQNNTASLEALLTAVNALPEAGPDTSDATAAAADILSGKTAYADGSKVTGTIPSKAAAAITPGTANQTIAAGQYLSGIQTILGDADLLPENIKEGVDIFGVLGTLAVADGVGDLKIAFGESVGVGTTVLPIPIIPASADITMLYLVALTEPGFSTGSVYMSITYAVNSYGTKLSHTRSINNSSSSTALSIDIENATVTVPMKLNGGTSYAVFVVYRE